MARLTTVLASGLVPKIGADRPIEGGIKEWFVKGTYQPDPTSTSAKVILDNVDDAQLTQYASHDFERFALSSWESFTQARYELGNGHSFSWTLLKLYYSAFFGAHALMRGQGTGAIKLESKHTQNLNSIIEIVSGSNPNIAAGMYVYKLVSETNRPSSVFLEPMGSSKGVHIGFWKLFRQFLNERAEFATQRGAADSLDFISGIEEVVRAIGVSAGSQGAWISAMRNQINYEHLHGVWQPVSRSQKIRTSIFPLELSASASIRLDLSHKSKPVDAFVNISKYLACLNYEISDVISQKPSASGAFGQKWRRLVKVST